MHKITRGSAWRCLEAVSERCAVLRRAHRTGDSPPIEW